MILQKIFNSYVSFVKITEMLAICYWSFHGLLVLAITIYNLWESDFQNQAHASGIFSDSGPVLAYYTTFVRTPFWGHQLVT